MIVGEESMFDLGQTHPVPGGRVPGRQDIFCADGREGMDCQGDYELFGLGQTMPPSRHRLPGRQDIYCPSGRQGMACEASGDLFGVGTVRVGEDVPLGTMRVSDDAPLGTMRVSDSAELGEESEFFGLGQEGLGIPGGTGNLVATGLGVALVGVSFFTKGDLKDISRGLGLVLGGIGLGTIVARLIGGGMKPPVAAPPAAK